MKLDFVELVGFRGFRDKERFEIPSGFVVLSGRNGAGKSTVLDAVEFALTGTINKFLVKEARGGGLDAHIWWVGKGDALEHYVTVGFVDEDGERFQVTRSRSAGCDKQPQQIMDALCRVNSDVLTPLETLLQMTLIRDEHIAALSLDLPEQSRFAILKAAIGSLGGQDFSERTDAIVATAKASKTKQTERVKAIQDDLGRTLSALTEARSVAARSANISEALQILESFAESLPSGLKERIEALRSYIAEKRLALREIERARSSVQDLQGEIAFWNSPEAEEQIANAESMVQSARERKTQAEEQFVLAVHSQQAEGAADEFATHLAALVEHGAALGLQEGHCPLCNAQRAETDFHAALTAARARIAERANTLSVANHAVSVAREELTSAEQSLVTAEQALQSLNNRRAALETGLKAIQDVYAKHDFNVVVSDITSAQTLLFAEHERLAKFDRALSILEGSDAVDRVKELEQRVIRLREVQNDEAAKLTSTEKAFESARQIESAAKTVQNQILTEQFDTVMPLLKELYRRLRPHTDWTEIESDFGGKVRASLNFTVGGYNPQFLFSSGQRRATGLAFLLAVHLSRPWCRWKSLMLDDPVQHIDDYRALNLVEVLSAIRRTDRQVIIAVEDPALADLLCRRLRSTVAGPARYYELSTSPTGSAQITRSQDILPLPKRVLRLAQAS
jgi:DNA repair exonuclease SbcCD ATPase subunit